MTRRPPAGGRLDVAMLAFAAVLLGGCRAGPKQQTLESATDEMLQLLVAHDYEAVIQRYVHPDDLKDVLEDKTLQELARGFGGQKAAELVDVLKHIKGRSPKLSEDGAKATFDLTGAGVGHGKIAFEKREGKWYLRN